VAEIAPAPGTVVGSADQTIQAATMTADDQRPRRRRPARLQAERTPGIAREDGRKRPNARPESALTLRSRARSDAKPDSTFAERALSAEEHTLWRGVIRSVAPLKRRPRMLLADGAEAGAADRKGKAVPVKRVHPVPLRGTA